LTEAENYICFLKPVHFHKNIVLQATSKYERFRIKGSYSTDLHKFCYAATIENRKMK